MRVLVSITPYQHCNHGFKPTFFPLKYQNAHLKNRHHDNALSGQELQFCSGFIFLKADLSLLPCPVFSSLEGWGRWPDHRIALGHQAKGYTRSWACALPDDGNANKPSSIIAHRAVVGKLQIADLLLQTINIQKLSPGILKLHLA